MGQSTDAILFYGYCWDEECELFPRPEEGEDRPEWQEAVACKRGHVNPWRDHPRPVDGVPYRERMAIGRKWRDDNRAALDAWDAACSAIKEEFGVDHHSHCSGECAMPYVCVEATRVVARRGHPEDITGRTLAAEMPVWDWMLDRWFAETGVKKPEGQKTPRWWLVSYWG